MLPLEHSAIIFTFIKLPFVIKIFGLTIFEWPFCTGFCIEVVLFTVIVKRPVICSTNGTGSQVRTVNKTANYFQFHKSIKTNFLYSNNKYADQPVC